MGGEKRRLYIPVNIKRRKELVDGFGKKELIKTAILTGSGILIGLIAYSITSEVISVILISGVGLFSGILFFRKDTINQSLVDKIRIMIDFSGSQKRFYYQYVNIYEKEVKKSEKHSSRGVDSK